MNLSGKNILVTGASSGIGREIAMMASRSGAAVFITGRNSGRLDETFRQLTGSGHKQLAANLCEEKDLANLADSLPPLDGMAYCAGITKPMPAKFIREDHLTEVMKINFFSPVLLTASLLRKGKINNGASIVLISSASVNLPYFGGSAYSASKAALESYCRTLAFELAQQKIRVNCIAPALIKTPVYDEMKSGFGKEKMDDYEKRYPLGFGEPVDAAHAAVFLLSDASGWITGTIIPLDGGLSLGT